MLECIYLVAKPESTSHRAAIRYISMSVCTNVRIGMCVFVLPLYSIKLITFGSQMGC